MKATIVFEKIWNAIHELDGDGKRKYRYIILTGSSRSSKTHSILQALHLYALQNDKKRISSWRETKKICKDTVLFDYRKIVPSLPNWTAINYNITNSIHTFPNGSVYEMCGGDDDVLIHGFSGDVAHFNEPYNMSKDTFDQIDMRTSDFLLIDWNPRQSHWIEELSKNPRAVVIHSTFRDNPFCPKEQRIKILSYDPSNPINVENGTANNWKWQVYGLGLKAEKPNRIFSWKECTLEHYMSITSREYIGIDWGKVDPFGIVGVKYHDGRLFIHEYNYDSEDTIRQKLNDANMNTEHGILNHVFERLKIDKSKVMICDTNRPEKGAFLRQKGYNVIPAPNKGILEGISILQSLEVYYTNCSENIRIEVENYEWDTDRAGVLERPIDAYNHTIDPTKYVVLYLRIMGVIKYL